MVYRVVRSLFQWALVLSELRETQEPAHAVLYSPPLIISDEVAHHYGNSSVRKKKKKGMPTGAKITSMSFASGAGSVTGRKPRQAGEGSVSPYHTDLTGHEDLAKHKGCVPCCLKPPLTLTITHGTICG